MEESREQSVAFERLTDFLAEMFELYGKEVLDEINTSEKQTLNA